MPIFAVTKYGLLLKMKV